MMDGLHFGYITKLNIEKKKKHTLLWSGVIICSFVPGVLVNPWALTPCTLKQKRNKGVVLTIVEGLLYLGRFHHTNYIIFKKIIQRNFFLMEIRDFLI